MVKPVQKFFRTQSVVEDFILFKALHKRYGFVPGFINVGSLSDFASCCRKFLQHDAGSLPMAVFFNRSLQEELQCRFNLFGLFEITQGAFGQVFALQVDDALI